MICSHDISHFMFVTGMLYLYIKFSQRVWFLFTGIIYYSGCVLQCKQESSGHAMFTPFPPFFKLEMTRNKACSNCFRHKKRCDNNRPCRRCSESFIPCEERVVTNRRRAHIGITTKACVECNLSKTRCGQVRPCMRCIRVGLLCHDVPDKKSISNNSLLSAVSTYARPGAIRFPEPSTQDMYDSLCASMDSLSPFTVADLFIDEKSLWFISTIGCFSSLIPSSKTTEISLRLFEHSTLDPYEHPLALEKLSYIHEPERYPNDSSQNSRRTLRGPLANLVQLNDNELVYYFMNSHSFKETQRYDSPPLAGVLVSLFKRDCLKHSVVLTHYLSPIAETIYGYTSEEFRIYQQTLVQPLIIMEEHFLSLYATFTMKMCSHTVQTHCGAS